MCSVVRPRITESRRRPAPRGPWNNPPIPAPVRKSSRGREFPICQPVEASISPRTSGRAPRETDSRRWNRAGIAANGHVHGSRPRSRSRMLAGANLIRFRLCSPAMEWSLQTRSVHHPPRRTGCGCWNLLRAIRSKSPLDGPPEFAARGTMTQNVPGSTRAAFAIPTNPHVSVFGVGAFEFVGVWPIPKGKALLRALLDLCSKPGLIPNHTATGLSPWSQSSRISRQNSSCR